MQEQDTLTKEVPGHLFSFEEKIFGIMTLSQFLIDLGALAMIGELTSSLSQGIRLAVCVVLFILVLILVHGKVRDFTLLRWIFLFSRSLTLPAFTTWQSLESAQSTKTVRKKGRSIPSVQTTWIQFDSLNHGIAGYSEPGSKLAGVGRYWAVFEVEGRNVRYLPEGDLIRLFHKFEAFLTGLEFRLQFLSLTSQVEPSAYAPMLAQKEAISTLLGTPKLARLQQFSLEFQQKQIQHCTITRHFVVVSVSAREEAMNRVKDEQRGILVNVLRFLFRSKATPITREHLLDQLRVRCSVIKKGFGQLDVRAWLLDDAEQLKLFASCLALGMEVPSFLPETLPDPIEKQAEGATALSKPSPESRTSRRTVDGTRVRTQLHQYCIKGLHRTFSYQSKSREARFEAGVLTIADLIAPSSIQIHPDMLEVQVQGKKRYQRYFTVTGYGHQLLCGWVGDLTELGLPMIVSTQFEPLDTRFMLQRLEMHLVKLESKRFADQKALKITRADQNIEAEQVRAMARELAARRMKIFIVTMTIGIHASSLEHLEQRTRYLLSHLRQKQLRVRTATRLHEQSWQSTLPTSAPLPSLDTAVNLPSSVCSTFLHASSGVIGTPSGVFLGFTGSGFSRRPVYFNPWSSEKTIPNPHVVVVGESGMGKSWLGKTIATGLMSMAIADVVVLDRDDDYLPLHSELDDESQRYNLGRRCPINFFDLPYGPDDVDPDDPADLLSEFLDNHLMLAIALIVTDTESGRASLSKIEEAYLTQVGRLAYARSGITSEAIRNNPETLLKPAPTLADFIVTMKETEASEKSMQISLIERLEKALYLFPGQTTISIGRPLTIFSIHDLDEKWYPLMTLVVQNFLYRHRALRRDERYLAYIVEEASYMLKHPAGRRYLESGSRGFRKLGIAQFTLSQHPRDFLEEGAVILSNSGTAFFLGMQPNAASKLNLSPELERTLTDAVPGQAVMRCGNEYAAITIAANPKLRAIFTTDPRERKKLRKLGRKENHAC